MKNRNEKSYNGRDWLKVELIRGVTKAGVAMDKRREEDRKVCRRKINPEDYGDCDE